MADDFDLVKISELPAATAPGEYDVLAGVQSGDTKQFSFATLLSWMEQAITASAIGAVPVTRKVNNKALSTDITLTASDVGAQPTISVSGILKGDGSGGISAAAAGTDYQTPLVAGTDYATPAMIPSVPSPSDATPQDLGTAAAGVSGNYSRADHVHDMPSAADVGAAPDTAGVYFGHCPTAANLQAKAVTIDGLTSLTYGTKIIVYFANAQTYNGTPTLKVNDFAAYEINRSPNYAVGEYEWAAGTTLELVFRNYNGSQMWLIVARGHATTTYYGLTKLSSSTSDSSTTLAATASAVKAAYDLADGKLDPGAILRFTAQAVSAGENQQILAISDAAITADYVLARIEFADPAYITAAGSWATAAGSFTMSGTATASTTADVLLVKKGN